MPVLLGGPYHCLGSSQKWLHLPVVTEFWVPAFPVSHGTFQKFFYLPCLLTPCSALLVSNPKHMALPYFHGPSYFTEFRASVCIPSTVFSISHHLPSSLSFPRLHPSSNSPILILRSPSSQTSLFSPFLPICILLHPHPCHMQTSVTLASLGLITKLSSVAGHNWQLLAVCCSGGVVQPKIRELPPDEDPPTQEPVQIPCHLGEATGQIPACAEGGEQEGRLCNENWPFHQSAIGIHICPLSWTPLPSPIIPQPSRLLQTTSFKSLNYTANNPCYLFYIWKQR